MSTFFRRLSTAEHSFILGPCLFETPEHMLEMILKIDSQLDEEDNWIYKTSWVKANRSSVKSVTGGIQNLDRMNYVKMKIRGLELTTDVHETSDIEYIEKNFPKLVDVYQIPAFLCRQTDLIHAAASTGKTVSIKKGQFMSPKDMGKVVEKASTFGSSEIILIERGTTFGYNALTVDMTSFKIMSEYAPVIFDATHSVQTPGIGGNPEFTMPLAQAALAAGAIGIFAEVHQKPSIAPSDSTNMLPLDKLTDFLHNCKVMRNAYKETRK